MLSMRPARAQTIPDPEKTLSTVTAGLMVESTEELSSPAHSGLKPGDVLLRWSSAHSNGEFKTPFDLRWVYEEEVPRGTVTLIGRRGDEARTWVMQPGRWDMELRPSMSPTLLAEYQQAIDLSAHGNAQKAEASWLQLAEHAGPEEPWLRVWIKARGGKELHKANYQEEGNRLYAGAAEECRRTNEEICRQVLLQQAESASSHGDWAASQKYAQLAVEKARETDSRLALAATLDRLGLSTMNRGDSAKAQEHLREALAIQEALVPESVEAARTLQYLGFTAINSDDLAEAEEFAYGSLRKLERVAPEGVDIIVSLGVLAVVANRRDDVVQQERFVRREAAIANRAYPGSSMQAMSDSSLAWVLLKLGDLQQAEQFGERALALAEKSKLSPYHKAQSLSLLGQLAIRRHDWQKAEAYLLRSLAEIEKWNPKGPHTIDRLHELEEMYLQKPDLQRATEYCHRAREMAVQLDPEGFYVATGDDYCGRVALAAGDDAGAEKYFTEAIEVLKRLKISPLESADLAAGLAKIRFRQKRFAEAEELYEQVMRSTDATYGRLGGGTQVRAGFRASLMEYYNGYIELLMQRNQPAHAFQVLEQSRARALLELLSSAHVDLQKGVDKSLVEKLRRLRAQISAKSQQRASLLNVATAQHELAELEKEITAASAQADAIEGRIRSASPAYAALVRPLSDQEVQKDLLDPDTLLLEYMLGPEHSYVFAVTSTSLEAFELAGREQIDQAARKVYSLLTARNRSIPGETDALRQRRLHRAQAELPAALTTLSQLVLGPVSAQIGGKRLAIVADGALHYIPFAMLPEPAPLGSATRHAMVPLVVGHEVVNLPSASVLAVLRQQQAWRRKASKAVVVFADPVFERTDPRINHAGPSVPRSKSSPSEDDSHSVSSDLLTRSAGDLGMSRDGKLSLPRLLFSRQEADAIGAVTPSGQLKEAVDFQASRAAATGPDLRDYRIVHFATHGLLNSEHPELSGLVLSLVDEHGQPQDGFLQLQDIYNLDLPADLVVLSACETGLGKEINGEGLIGLTRGFMYAGASRVVASLWKVSDAATASLMAEFYRAMEKDHMSPAAALRTAQIHMWQQKRWTSPYYWAAFQIQGEWK